MNITAAQKTKTGIFVLVILAMLIGLLVLIGNQKNLFGDTFVVNTQFKNIAGTKEGSFVRFAGINIGTVQTINIINDSTVQLSLSIEKKIQPFIKTDAVTSIGSDGLMGDRIILIAPGNNGSPSVKEGTILRSNNPVDVDKILSNLSKVSDNATVLTDGLANIVGRINKGQGSIGRLLVDNSLADKMETTIATAQNTATNITKTANSVNENMQAVKSSFLLRGYFKKKERKRIKDSTEKANKLISNKKTE
jgi:phospholipid/cholesterol/gamma-HCH transport system substrate-binding protein